MNASLNGRDVFFLRVGACKAHDRLHHRQGIARSVVDLARKQQLALLGLLAIGDVEHDHTDRGSMLRCIGGNRTGAFAVSDLTVWTNDAELSLESLRIGPVADKRLEPGKIIPRNHLADVVNRRGVFPLESEDAELAGVAGTLAGRKLPFPRAHLRRGQRDTSAAFAFAQSLGGGLHFGGPLRDPAFQFTIKILKLTSLTVEFR